MMSDFEQPPEPPQQRPQQQPPPPPSYQTPIATNPPPGPIQTRRRTSGKAVFAFLFGFVSFVLWIFAGLPAFILALQAKSEMRRDPNLRGRGLANLGLLMVFISFFALPAIVMIALVTGTLGNFGTMSDDYAGDTNRIVHLHLSGILSDSPAVDSFMSFGGLSMSLSGLIDTIEEAEYDDSVVAIVITLDTLSIGLSQIEEILAAFSLFADSGKEIYVHTEEPSISTGTYALFSAATHFNAVPTANIDLIGMYSNSMYLKEGLAEIGIEADVVHIGDYKSAGEMMMRDGPSEAAEEATNWLLDGLFESLVGMIATSRDFTTDEVLGLIDGGPYSAAQAVENGLIDSRMYLDELTDHLRDEYGDDIYFDNNYGSLYETTGQDGSSAAWYDMDQPGKIGLVFLEGNILSGYGQGGAYSATLRRALDQAASDDSIEAVVIRINSPGGSVTASEVILRAIQRLNEEKPVVISMGDVAASGGYYVACQADAIFANETTITGSIGVVGGKIVTAGLWEKLGVYWHAITRGKNANWTSGAAPFTDEQREMVTESMGDAYRIFKEHVVKGREDKLTKDLEEMAGGRVFTGKQALELGLIDEIGGLNDALYYAAELVDLDDFDVQLVPEVLDFNEQLMRELFGTGEDHPSDLRVNPLARTTAMNQLRVGAKQTLNEALATSLLEKLDPETAKATQQLIRNAQLLNQEGVVAIMPEVIVVH